MSNTKKQHLIFNGITWALVLIMFLFLIVFLNNMSKKIDALEAKINQLQKNETLVLLQLQDEEQNIQTMRKSIFDIDLLINKYSKQYGVDRNLAHSVAKVESNKQQTARSKTGAVGVFQIMPSTGKAMHENVYTTDGNIRAGIKYLAYLNKKFNGDTDKVLSAYNAGPSIVSQKGVLPSTQKYIKKVKTEKAKLDNK